MAWLEVGARSGPVVVYFHGTAKGKQELLYPDAADRLGIRLLMADRPGYGSSRPDARATFAKFARMVLDDLDDEGVGQFSMLGWSGGGPHGLACAAIAPQRVHAVGLLASWAPMHPPDRGRDPGVSTRSASWLRSGSSCGTPNVMSRSPLRRGAP